MTPSPSSVASVGPPACRVLEGFTLLEVLVAIAILVFALAGIAALLPATGARLAEATDVDRAGALAANARSDLLARGACRAALWSGTSVTASTRAIVFGEGLTIGGTAVTLTSATATIAVSNTAALWACLNQGSAFQMRDNLITSGAGIVTGNVDGGICYGCMLSSTVALSGTSAGAQVRMTTVVFRRPGTAVQLLSLTQTTTPTVFRLSGASADALRRQYLAGCSWVVAWATGTQPVWVPVASSWTTGTSGTIAYVCLSGASDYSQLMSGSTLQVFGFNGLLQVDERTIRLE